MLLPSGFNMKCNVNYWLRKVFYYVENLEGDPKVPVDNETDKPGEESELEMRRRLKKDGILDYEPEVIVHKEAVEACTMLSRIFREALDVKVLEFIADPRCPGAKPRGSVSG